jgi:hypothetical protein
MEKKNTFLPEQDIDIEQIMGEIREQILAGKAAASPGGKPIVPAKGTRFSAELYEHLYYAGVNYDQVGVKMHVSTVPIPILGPIIEWIRGKLHELVLYYVNQVSAKQIKVNMHLLRAVSTLIEELEVGEGHS